MNEVELKRDCICFERNNLIAYLPFSLLSQFDFPISRTFLFLSFGRPTDSHISCLNTSINVQSALEIEKTDNISFSINVLVKLYAFILRSSRAVHEREREREMQWGSRESLIEQAKEEIEILEQEHPNKFTSLKQELRAFISQLEAELLLDKPTTISIFAETQESSTTNNTKNVVKRRRCKTDAVLERAQQCLHKIQHLKTSLS
ncbi:uncharacterized protein LOC131023748 [Salvia miltiorrhiza]|uniref:uncharacterized protein LOC131023748 n=1 Tax=Salvia miltiorrhiza TaxID=226208 RepID=UPI0025AD6C61|nr:uncharacterized protein LOC131023748 [Salvia miltiorrhiza]